MTSRTKDAVVRAAQRVVCAALLNKDGRIVCGPRHFDQTMLVQIKERPGVNTWRDAEQGFIDQHGIFLNREEAWGIAERNGQILRRVGSYIPSLFSENLY